MSVQFKRLIEYLEPLSEPGMDVRTQWVGHTYYHSKADAADGATCRCGQQHIRYIFSLKNKHNGSIASPIGSQCVLRFEDEILSAWAKDKVNQTHKEQRDERKRAMEPEPVPEPVANLACLVSDCQECTADVRHQYCPTHFDQCKAVNSTLVGFGKHKVLYWYELVKDDVSYCNWALDNRYNTQPGEPHHEKNKIIEAYIKNELSFFKNRT